MRTAQEVLKKLDEVRDLPTLPEVAQRIGKTARDPHADAKDLAKVIEDDPAVMAKILKVVNSALYAGTEDVTSVQHAVARMGMSTVSNIAMSTSVFSAFGSGDDDQFDIKGFWHHSISTGIASVVVYERAKGHMDQRYGSDILHLAGLIHDIGKILLVQHYHDDFMEALAFSRSEGVPLYEAERKVIGVDHCEVGSWLGVKWNLDRNLLHAMRWHHNPTLADEESWGIAALCHTANYICNLQGIGDGGDCSSPTFSQEVWKKLGLSVGDISSVVDEVMEESKKSEVLMSFA